jgi:hypothetical protein
MATASRGENKFGEKHSAMCGKWGINVKRDLVQVLSEHRFPLSDCHSCQICFHEFCFHGRPQVGTGRFAKVTDGNSLVSAVTGPLVLGGTDPVGYS